MKRKWIKGLIGLTMTCCVLMSGCAPQETGNQGVSSEEGTESQSQQMSQQESQLQGTEGQETQIPEPVVTTVTISATGDCTLGVTQTHGYEGSFHEYYDKNGAEYFFSDVKEIFEADDFTLVNLECVLTEATDRVEKTWNLKGKPEYTKIRTSSSVEGCSLGNNHTLDYGEVSLTDTISALDQAGIVYGYNEQTAIYTTSQGIRIGGVSANLLSETEKYENYIRDGIADLRTQGADLVIASCHWGIELDHYPTQYQQDMAHQIVDWGADVVIGNHPHVLQGIEVYNGKVICYSLGNFCFGGNRNPDNKDTMIYQQTFTFVDGKLQEQLEARIIPCTISSIESRNDFQPTVADGERKASIIEDVSAYSQPYGDLVIDTDGGIAAGE